MTEHSFSLIPFPDSNIPDIKIAGRISRQAQQFSVQFSLTGNVEQLLLPESSAHPTRKDELWKSTCFEFFIATPNKPEYWEFNTSPSGHWNVYHMDAYRRVGFREETRIQRLSFSVQRDSGCVSVDAAVDLSPIVRADESILVGITSIIQTHDGHETYWALAHPHPQADFHLRESFTLELAG